LFSEKWKLIEFQKRVFLKKVAFIFPGQGSQAVGMGKDFFENSEKAKEIIEEASSESGIDFQKLLFTENSDLEKTEFTQPAILLVSQIAYELFREKAEIEPKYLLGHSLGEFSALVSAGALDLNSAVKLVNRRGELMKEACENVDAGMMAVIGISDENVEKVCETARENGKKVWGANFNSDGQVVLAGIKSDLESIQPDLKEAKAKKSVVLNMSVASHCQLLESATGELKKELEDKLSENFSAPIVSNVTAKPYQNREEAIELLTKQLVSPVKYSDSIRNIADEVDLFIEFGHGGVLRGLNKRIVKGVPTIVVSDMASLEKALEEIK
jgi:[acyl-carrier-protein] S-malonyltransferase